MPFPLFLKHRFQIFYSVLLVILIPLSIVFNSYYLVSSLRKAMDQELQWKALLAERVFNVLAVEEINRPEVLQLKVQKIGRENTEIRALDVMIPDLSSGNDLKFKIIASLDPSFVGRKSDLTNNLLVWQRQESFAYLTFSKAASTEQQQVRPSETGTERFWIVTSPLFDNNQNKVGLVSLKLSLVGVDNVVDSALFKSYFILGITLLIILLIIISNTRLFQYAILFKKIKEVDQMKDEFISVASHELRSPITSITGYLSMFLEGSFGKLNAKAKEKLTIVFDSVQRLNLLVNDLLDVSRIDQKRISLDLKPEKLDDILVKILPEFESQASIKKLKVVFTKPAQPLSLIKVDADKLRQIIVNIVSNAIKYTPNGTVSIYTEEKNGWLSLKVKDSGLGMDANERENLFQKFYRVKSEQTKQISGTGLGLWITKQLVELMKGKIYVDSIKGVGTEFTISFPVVKK